MGFINPGFLWFFALGAVPFIIHSLSSKKYKTVPFSALHFLLSKDKTMLRISRLKGIYLLLLRALILILLALAFTGPFIKKSGILPIAQGPSSLLLILDRSVAMACAPQGIDLLTLARSQLKNHLESLPPGSEAGLVLYSDSQDIERINFTSPERIMAHLENVALTFRNPEPQAALATALSMLEGATHDNNGILFCGAGLNLDKVPSNLKIMEMLPENFNNAGIVNLIAKPEKIGLSMPIEIQGILQNFGDQDLDSLPCFFSQDGVKRDERVVQLKANSRLVVKFTTSFSESGWHFISVGIKNDAFSLDDERQIAVFVPQDIRVLLVESEKPSYIPISETFFAFLALNPYSGQNQKNNCSILPTTAPYSALNSLNPSSFHTIILSNPSELGRENAKKLADFAFDGGGLILSAGPETKSQDFNEIWHGLLPGQAFVQDIISSAGQNPFSLKIPRDHPIVQALDRDENNIVPDIFLKSFRQLQLSHDWQNLAEAQDGGTVLALASHGAGKIALLATGLSQEWSDIPLSPAFLPLLHGLIYDLSGTKGTAPSFMPHKPPLGIGLFEIPRYLRKTRNFIQDKNIFPPGIYIAYRGENLINVVGDLETGGENREKKDGNLKNRVENLVNGDIYISQIDGAELEKTWKSVSQKGQSGKSPEMVHSPDTRNIPINAPLFLLLVLFLLLEAYFSRKKAGNGIGYGAEKKTGNGAGFLPEIIRALCLLSFMILAVDPFIVKEEKRLAPSRVAVFVDNSASMGIKTDNFDKGQSARKIVDSLKKNLKNRLPIQIFSFAHDVKKLKNAQELSFDGGGTDITNALETALNQSTSSDHIILITDGRHNGPQEVNAPAKKLKERLYTLYPPVEIEIKDTGVSRMELPNIAFAGEELEIKVQIIQNARESFQVPLALFRDEKMLERRMISFEKGRATALFQDRPPQGNPVYKAVISPPEDDCIKSNNQYSSATRIISSKIPILLLASSPSHSLSFLLKALSEDPEISLNWGARVGNKFMGSLKSADLLAQKLEKYSLIIFHDPDGELLKKLDYSSLEKAISERGIGLFSIMGHNFSKDPPSPEYMTLFGLNGKPLYAQGLFPPHFNIQDTVLRLSPIPDINESLLKNITPLNSLVKGLNMAPSMVEFAHFQDYPVGAWHNHGEGRIMSLLTDSLWQGGFSSAMAGDFDIFGRLIRNISRFLLPPGRDMKELSLIIPMGQISANMAFEVEIHARDNQGFPRSHANLTLDLDGRPIKTNQLSTGIFTALVPPLERGLYSLNARCLHQEGQSQISQQIIVSNAPGELDIVTNDMELLEKLGQIIQPGKEGELIEKILENTPVIVFEKRVKFNLNPYILLILAGLISSIWIIRKRRGLDY